jgi:hypothetical protein
MTSTGNHAVFSYEAIYASEQSRLHLGNVYNYTNINYCTAPFPCSPWRRKLTAVSSDIGLPSVKHDVPASSSTEPTDAPYASPSPRLIANYQEAHHSLPADLYAEYKVRPARFFEKGRVFIAVSPQAPESIAFSLRNTYGNTWPYHDGEEGTPKVQRFIVVREGEHYCNVLPISTYGGRGVAKQSVKELEHAIIYDGAHGPPTPQNCELPRQGEAGMLSTAIRVDVDLEDYQLDPRSRINLGSVFFIRHSARVKSLGMVGCASMEALQRQFMIAYTEQFSQMPRLARNTVISHVNKGTIVGQNHNVEEDCAGRDDGEEE